MIATCLDEKVPFSGNAKLAWEYVVDVPSQEVVENAVKVQHNHAFGNVHVSL